MQENWQLSTRIPRYLTLLKYDLGVVSDDMTLCGLQKAHNQFYKEGNLVDPASNYMLVSKIKPCMSKYKQACTVKLRMAHYISYSLFDSGLLHG